MTETRDQTRPARSEPHAIVVSRAWKRLFLANDGGLKDDAKLALKDLMDECEFFGRGYVLGDHDKTLELAVKRRIINHILVALDISERHIWKRLAIARGDDE